MIFALPFIYDGECQRWPVHKFRLFNLIEQPRILQPPRMIVSPGQRWGASETPRRYKFPTRRLAW
jgi:hypothetical protein